MSLSPASNYTTRGSFCSSAPNPQTLHVTSPKAQDPAGSRQRTVIPHADIEKASFHHPPSSVMFPRWIMTVFFTIYYTLKQASLLPATTAYFFGAVLGSRQNGEEYKNFPYTPSAVTHTPTMWDIGYSQ